MQATICTNYRVDGAANMFIAGCASRGRRNLGWRRFALPALSCYVAVARFLDTEVAFGGRHETSVVCGNPAVGRLR